MANPRIQDLGIIGISLLGIWIVAQGVLMLAFVLPGVFSGAFDSFDWGPVFAFVVYALLGAMLILCRSVIASSLFHEISPDLASMSPPLAESLLALLGLWFVVHAVAQAAQVESNLLLGFSAATPYGDRLSFLASSQAWSQRAPYLIKAAAGAWFILGARKLTATWSSSRFIQGDHQDHAA